MSVQQEKIECSIDTSAAAYRFTNDLGVFGVLGEEGFYLRSVPEQWRENNDTLRSGMDCMTLVEMDGTRVIVGNSWAQGALFSDEAARSQIAERFNMLKRQWQKETLLFSSLTKIVMHPAYQRIIGIGPPAVPLILRELEQKPNHWFWALKVITGADPVEPSQRGRMKEMTRAWLRWGKEQGLDF
jgi:hypothetical protein